MLNPDGVARGHYRLDNFGINLNRMYENPNPQEHPSIYAVTRLLKSLDSQDSNNKLFLYMDLHAHAGKRGCFIYGNHFESFEQQVTSNLYPRMIAANTCNFDYEECNFTEKLMKKKDKSKKDQDGDSMSREGAGRVAIHKLLGGLIHSYTLECNYCCGTRVNKIQKRFDTFNNRYLKETDALLDPFSKHYSQF